MYISLSILFRCPCTLSSSVVIQSQTPTFTARTKGKARRAVSLLHLNMSKSDDRPSETTEVLQLRVHLPVAGTHTDSAWSPSSHTSYAHKRHAPCTVYMHACKPCRLGYTGRVQTHAIDSSGAWGGNAQQEALCYCGLLAGLLQWMLPPYTRTSYHLSSALSLGSFCSVC